MSIDEIDSALQNHSKQPIKVETTNIIYVDSEMIYISGSLLTKKRRWILEYKRDKRNAGISAMLER